MYQARLNGADAYPRIGRMHYAMLSMDLGAGSHQGGKY